MLKASAGKPLILPYMSEKELPHEKVGDARRLASGYNEKNAGFLAITRVANGTPKTLGLSKF